MAKKKKRKDENVEPKGYVIELKGIFLVLVAILSTPFIEWKAYMLKNLYELNKKGR